MQIIYLKKPGLHLYLLFNFKGSRVIGHLVYSSKSDTFFFCFTRDSYLISSESVRLNSTLFKWFKKLNPNIIDLYVHKSPNFSVYYLMNWFTFRYFRYSDIQKNVRTKSNPSLKSRKQGLQH